MVLGWKQAVSTFNSILGECTYMYVMANSLFTGLLIRCVWRIVNWTLSLTLTFTRPLCCQLLNFFNFISSYFGIRSLFVGCLTKKRTLVLFIIIFIYIILWVSPVSIMILLKWQHKYIFFKVTLGDLSQYSSDIKQTVWIFAGLTEIRAMLSILGFGMITHTKVKADVTGDSWRDRKEKLKKTGNEWN